MKLRLKRWKSRLWLLVLLGLSLGTVLGWHRQPLRCLFKSLTGYPCPGCGSLRAMYALSHGHWLQALELNPLALCALVILGGYAVIRAYDEWQGTDYSRIFRRALPWWSYALLGTLVLCNWFYLIQQGR